MIHVIMLVIGIIVGALAHKWLVREDLLLADKVKVLLAGAKAKADVAMKAVKDEAGKVEGEVKDEIKHVEGK